MTRDEPAAAHDPARLAEHLDVPTYLDFAGSELGRVAVALRYMHDFSIAEIALVLGVSTQRASKLALDSLENIRRKAGIPEK